MGLLFGETENILPYDQSKPRQKLVRKNAALQLFELLERFKGFKKSVEEENKYGTEAEAYLLDKVNINGEILYTVNINTPEYMKVNNFKHGESVDFKEEFSAWMVEILPRQPFNNKLDYNELHEHFNYITQTFSNTKNDKNKLLIGGSILPHMGTLNYYMPPSGIPIPLEDREGLNEVSGSTTFLDSTITDHARFRGLTNNVRVRRGTKPDIRVPIYQDANTKVIEAVTDHFGYGMGCLALQVTFSCKSMDDCRFLYDQMHVLSAFAQTLSNSSAIANSKLIDWDSRWKLIEQSTDDRKPEEIGKLEKGRYGTINYYISNDPRNKKIYNDKKFTLNKKFRRNLKRLFKSRKCELYKDTRLLNHYGYLFVRESLVVFESRHKENNIDDTVDFETIQSTNWNDVRFKPPGSFESQLGWLMEFRSMDSPLTSREKAALIFLVKLFKNMIMDKQLGVNFYIPISKVDENFNSAVQRDSDINAIFHFRRYFSKHLHGKDYLKDEWVSISLLEFFEGNDQFSGMKSLISAYIDINNDELETESKRLGYDLKKRIWDVYGFYVARAKRELISNARFIRNFVLKHKSYNYDSMVSDQVVTDLIDELFTIQENDYCEELLGTFLKDM